MPPFVLYLAVLSAMLVACLRTGERLLHVITYHPAHTLLLSFDVNANGMSLIPVGCRTNKKIVQVVIAVVLSVISLPVRVIHCHLHPI